MENKVLLNVETNKGIVVIPFNEFKDLDLFTVGYENERELVESLNEMLDLSIDMEDAISVYITSDKYEKMGKNGFIKYRDDNYNLDSLEQVLAWYFKQDHKRIRKSDVRFVITKGMIDFNAGKDISDHDIDLAVRAYLNNNYKKQRDMYFLVKNFAPIRNDKVSLEASFRKMPLSDLESYEDGFVQYLIELASRDEERFELAMDELSRVELDEINKALADKSVGIFDGLSKGNHFESEEEYSIVMLTGFSIEELKDMQKSYNRDFGRRR